MSLVRGVVAKLEKDKKTVHAEVETLAKLPVSAFTGKWKDWVRISVVEFFEDHLGFNFGSSGCLKIRYFFFSLYTVS